MKLRYLVATKHTSGLKQKLVAVKKMMETSPDIEVEFVINKKDYGKPDVYKDAEGSNRITQEWFEKSISKDTRPQGFDGAIFLFSMRDGRRWNLDSGIRGSTFNDKDGFGEMWVRGDRLSVTRFKDGSKRDRITKTIAHEIGHDLKHRGLTTLEIHDFDFKDEINNIEQFWLSFKIDKTEVQTLWQKVANLRRAVDIFLFKKGG